MCRCTTACAPYPRGVSADREWSYFFIDLRRRYINDRMWFGLGLTAIGFGNLATDDLLPTWLWIVVGMRGSVLLAGAGHAGRCAPCPRHRGHCRREGAVAVGGMALAGRPDGRSHLLGAEEREEAGWPWVVAALAHTGVTHFLSRHAVRRAAKRRG